MTESRNPSWFKGMIQEIQIQIHACHEIPTVTEGAVPVMDVRKSRYLWKNSPISNHFITGKDFFLYHISMKRLQIQARWCEEQLPPLRATITFAWGHSSGFHSPSLDYRRFRPGWSRIWSCIQKLGDKTNLTTLLVGSSHFVSGL